MNFCPVSHPGNEPSIALPKARAGISAAKSRGLRQ